MHAFCNLLAGTTRDGPAIPDRLVYPSPLFYSGILNSKYFLKLAIHSDALRLFVHSIESYYFRHSFGKWIETLVSRGSRVPKKASSRMRRFSDAIILRTECLYRPLCLLMNSPFRKSLINWFIRPPKMKLNMLGSFSYKKVGCIWIPMTAQFNLIGTMFSGVGVVWTLWNKGCSVKGFVGGRRHKPSSPILCFNESITTRISIRLRSPYFMHFGTLFPAMFTLRVTPRWTILDNLRIYYPTTSVLALIILCALAASIDGLSIDCLAVVIYCFIAQCVAKLIPQLDPYSPSASWLCAFVPKKT